MKVKKCMIEGLLIIEPQVFSDDRGYFFEQFNSDKYSEIGIKNTFVQDNQSYSKYGTFRGMHFQKGEYAQAKLVSVLKGKVIDYVVDIRRNSKTFGKSFSIEISAENKLQLFIPRGFAHGFLVLSDCAIFQYKCDNYYNKNSEGGIRFDDPQIAIELPISKEELIISPKDLELTYLTENIML